MTATAVEKTEVRDQSSTLKLIVNKLAHVLGGKALERYKNNVNGIQDRFNAESLKSRRQILGRDINCLDLDEMHYPDPSFGTEMFPEGAKCFVDDNPITEIPFVSLVIRKNGEFAEDQDGGLAERGNVQVVFMYGHYFPVFLCNGCRGAKEAEKTTEKSGTFKVKFLSRPQSYRRASSEAKRRNAGRAALIAAEKEAAEKSVANIASMLQAPETPVQETPAKEEVEILTEADLIPEPKIPAPAETPKPEPTSEPKPAKKAATRKRASRKVTSAVTT